MRPLQLTNTHQERQLQHFHAHIQDLKSPLGLDTSQTSPISLTVHPMPFSPRESWSSSQEILFHPNRDDAHSQHSGRRFGFLGSGLWGRSL